MSIFKPSKKGDNIEPIPLINLTKKSYLKW